MSGRSRLVVDIGGTSLRVGRLDPGGALETVEHRATPSVHGGEDPAQVLAALARQLRAMTLAVGAGEPGAVVVGFPGPIRPNGEILAAPTVWQGNNELTAGVLAVFRDTWPLAEVTVMNDVSAAGFSIVESGRQDFALVTVSSGVGAKLFLDGRPVTGNGEGGEIGHVTYTNDQPPVVCECGGTNHLGAVASGRGILTTYARLRQAVVEQGGAAGGPAALDRTEEVLDAALRGEPTAFAAVGTSAAAVAHSLALTHAICGVTAFFLMGGVVDHLGSMYVDEVRRAAGRCCDWLGQDWVGMVRTHPERDPGLLGAAAYLRMRHPVLGGYA